MPVITNCLVCNKEIRKKPSAAAKGQGKYCSKKCMSIGYSDRNSGVNNPNYHNAGNKTCPICHKEFKSYYKTQVYCSVICAKVSLRVETVSVTCQSCGKEFQVKKSAHAREPRKYCSAHCARQKKFTIVQKRIRKPKIPKVCAVCGKAFMAVSAKHQSCSRACSAVLSGMKQRKRVVFVCAICGKSMDVAPSAIKYGRKVCSIECHKVYSRLQQLGDKSHRWQGGKTKKTILHRNSLPYKQWRTAVFKRDGYTCQLCGRKGGKLAVHHIKTYSDHPDLREDVSNGITLCWHPCHTSIKGKEGDYEADFIARVQARTT